MLFELLIVCIGPKGTLHVNEEGIDGVTGAEVADGCDGCRKAVRRQIGAGADWIKVNSHNVCYFMIKADTWILVLRR